MDGQQPGAMGRRWGIGLCAAAVVLGGLLALAGYLRASGVGDRIGGYPAVAAGSEERVRFESAGGKTAYFESTCFACRGESVTNVPALEIVSEEGDEVEVGDYATDGAASPQHTGGFLSYDRGRFEGEPEYTFHIPEPGVYRVRVAPSDAPDAQMRLGPSIVPVWWSGVAMVVGGVALGGVLLVAGLIVLAVAAGRRRRWRRLSSPATGWVGSP